jgi:hypothetical protein
MTDRVVKAGSRGPNGDPQGGRDLRERIPNVVMEDDHRSLFWSQPPEGVFEVVARGDGARHVW